MSIINVWTVDGDWFEVDLQPALDGAGLNFDHLWEQNVSHDRYGNMLVTVGTETYTESDSSYSYDQLILVVDRNGQVADLVTLTDTGYEAVLRTEGLSQAVFFDSDSNTLIAHDFDASGISDVSEVVLTSEQLNAITALLPVGSAPAPGTFAITNDESGYLLHFKLPSGGEHRTALAKVDQTGVVEIAYLDNLEVNDPLVQSTSGEIYVRAFNSDWIYTTYQVDFSAGALVEVDEYEYWDTRWEQMQFDAIAWIPQADGSDIPYDFKGVVDGYITEVGAGAVNTSDDSALIALEHFNDQDPLGHMSLVLLTPDGNGSYVEAQVQHYPNDVYLRPLDIEGLEGELYLQQLNTAGDPVVLQSLQFSEAGFDLASAANIATLPLSDLYPELPPGSIAFVESIIESAGTLVTLGGGYDPVADDDFTTFYLNTFDLETGVSGSPIALTDLNDGELFLSPMNPSQFVYVEGWTDQTEERTLVQLDIQNHQVTPVPEAFMHVMSGNNEGEAPVFSFNGIDYDLSALAEEGQFVVLNEYRDSHQLTNGQDTYGVLQLDVWDESTLTERQKWVVFDEASGTLLIDSVFDITEGEVLTSSYDAGQGVVNFAFVQATGNAEHPYEVTMHGVSFNGETGFATPYPYYTDSDGTPVTYDLSGLFTGNDDGELVLLAGSPEQFVLATYERDDFHNVDVTRIALLELETGQVANATVQGEAYGSGILFSPIEGSDWVYVTGGVSEAFRINSDGVWQSLDWSFFESLNIYSFSDDQAFDVNGVLFSHSDFNSFHHAYVGTAGNNPLIELTKVPSLGSEAEQNVEQVLLRFDDVTPSADNGYATIAIGTWPDGRTELPLIDTLVDDSTGISYFVTENLDGSYNIWNGNADNPEYLVEGVILPDSDHYKLEELSDTRLVISDRNGDQYEPGAATTWLVDTENGTLLDTALVIDLGHAVLMQNTAEPNLWLLQDWDRTPELVTQNSFSELIVDADVLDLSGIGAENGSPGYIRVQYTSSETSQGIVASVELPDTNKTAIVVMGAGDSLVGTALFDTPAGGDVEGFLAFDGYIYAYHGGAPEDISAYRIDADAFALNPSQAWELVDANVALEQYYKANYFREIEYPNGSRLEFEGSLEGYFVSAYDAETGSYTETELDLGGVFWNVDGRFEPGSFLLRHWESSGDGDVLLSVKEVTFNAETNAFQVADLLTDVRWSTVTDLLPETNGAGESLIYSLRPVESGDDGSVILSIRSATDENFDYKQNEVYIASIASDGSVNWITESMVGSHYGSLSDYDLVPRDYDGSLYIQLKDLSDGSPVYYNISSDGSTVTEISEVEFSTADTAYPPNPWTDNSVFFNEVINYPNGSQISIEGSQDGYTVTAFNADSGVTFEQLLGLEGNQWYVRAGYEPGSFMMIQSYDTPEGDMIGTLKEVTVDFASASVTLTDFVTDLSANSVTASLPQQTTDGQPLYFLVKYVEAGDDGSTAVTVRSYTDPTYETGKQNSVYVANVAADGSLNWITDSITGSHWGNLSDFDLVPRSHDSSLYIQLQDLSNGNPVYYNISADGSVVTPISADEFATVHDQYPDSPDSASNVIGVVPFGDSYQYVVTLMEQSEGATLHSYLIEVFDDQGTLVDAAVTPLSSDGFKVRAGWEDGSFMLYKAADQQDGDRLLTAFEVTYLPDAGTFDITSMLDDVSLNALVAHLPGASDGTVFYTPKIVEAGDNDSVILMRGFTDPTFNSGKLNESYALVIDKTGQVVMTSEPMGATFSGSLSNFDMVPRLDDGTMYFQMQDNSSGATEFFAVGAGGDVWGVSSNYFFAAQDQYAAAKEGAVIERAQADGSTFQMEFNDGIYTIRYLDQSGSEIAQTAIDLGSDSWRFSSNWEHDSIWLTRYSEDVNNGWQYDAKELSLDDQGSLVVTEAYTTLSHDAMTALLPQASADGSALYYAPKLVDTDDSGTVLLMRGFKSHEFAYGKENSMHVVQLNTDGSIAWTVELAGTFSGSLSNFEAIPRELDGNLYLMNQDKSSEAFNYYQVDGAGAVTDISMQQFEQVLSTYNSDAPIGVDDSLVIQIGDVFVDFSNEANNADYFELEGPYVGPDGTELFILNSVRLSDGYYDQSLYRIDPEELSGYPSGTVLSSSYDAPHSLHTYSNIMNAVGEVDAGELLFVEESPVNADQFMLTVRAFDSTLGISNDVVKPLGDVMLSKASLFPNAVMPTEASDGKIYVEAADGNEGYAFILLGINSIDLLAATNEFALNTTGLAIVDRTDGSVLHTQEIQGQPLEIKVDENDQLFIRTLDQETQTEQYFSVAVADAIGNDAVAVSVTEEDFINALPEAGQLREDTGLVADETLKATFDAGDLNGYQGDDKLFGDGLHNTLNGGEGNDLLIGGGGYDTAQFSGNADDYILTMMSDYQVDLYNRLLSFEGEQFSGTGGVLTVMQSPVDGSDGVDIVQVEELQFADRTYTVEDGVLMLSDLSDQFQGGNGADVVSGEGGSSNSIAGGRGNDALFANGGAINNLSGQEDDDVLTSLAGMQNNLQGGSGNDYFLIDQNDGGDVLISGDSDADTTGFVDLMGDGINVDVTIAGFEVGLDKIDLSVFGIDYQQLTAGNVMVNNSSNMAEFDLGALGLNNVDGSLTVMFDSGSLGESDFMFAEDSGSGAASAAPPELEDLYSGGATPA